jgi:predicted NBD/HSP70 family sugar kinase
MEIDNSIYVGLDIGGTKFLVASSDAGGGIIDRVQLPTPAGLDEGFDQLHSMITQVSKDHRIKAMGAAIGGPLDFRTGIVSPLHQPEWRDVPLKEIMERKWGCPFFVDVDTNVAALAEYHFGGVRASRLLYLTLSTGMGGGFMVDGRIYRGMNGAHPEAAHQSVNFRCRHPERVACECGAPDCLEALVSGNGIRRIYGRPAEMLDESEWEEVTFNLGLGLRNLAVLYLPDVIVLGGGLAIGRGERLAADASAVMRQRLHLVPHPDVRLSRLGHDTALMGAIAAAIFGLA